MKREPAIAESRGKNAAASYNIENGMKAHQGQLRECVIQRNVSHEKIYSAQRNEIEKEWPAQ